MHQCNNFKRWALFKPIFFLSFITIIWFTFPSKVIASKNYVSFQAEAILPDNQQSQASYYDLKVVAGSKQALQLRLKNTSEKTVTVKIEANNGCTNKNGALDYSDPNQKLLGGPTFKDMISPSQVVTLKKGETKKISFQLTIPKKGFNGTILGGFYLYEIEKKNDEKKDGLQLTNKFAYTIGVKLIENEVNIAPQLLLAKVKPGLDNGYLTLFATLENPKAVLLSRLDMDAYVTKKNQKDKIQEVIKKVSFAPRCTFNLPLSWKNTPLKSGNYTLTVLLQDSSGKKWKLAKDFKIDQKDETLNKKAVRVPKEKRSVWLYGIIAICLIVIFILLAYILKLRQKKSLP
ncbi:cell surface protein [Enterococcus saigonensis]|uniref:Cell surface protein n=1 Tax=Enterococcus saigonensis TaxID=1805431 RepID=A0A679IA04_9ENTE|nr:DUF916 and DUF3324 domain-containing protein [Enterococcus saigonensis]BCA85210.1 cell surface protein [Enterococcus saigonensis]